MVNSDSVAVATFPTPDGRVEYRGDVAIAGVPGTAAPVVLAFTDTEGSATGRLLPTGNVRDTDRRHRGHLRRQRDARRARDGRVVRAQRRTRPTRSWPRDTALLERVDAFRRKAGQLDGPRRRVRLVGARRPRCSPRPATAARSAPARSSRCSRTPRSACWPRSAWSPGMLLPGAVGHELTADWPRDRSQVDVEHPTGHLLVDVVVDADATPPRVVRSGGRPHRPQALRRHRLPPRADRRPQPARARHRPLGHVEIRTPGLGESLEFFTRYLGLTENGSVGDSVFLRAWDDYENVTIKLTAHATSGIGRTTFRAASPEALQRRVAQIEAAGRGVGWQDGDPGTGRPTSSPTPTATSSASTTRARGTAARRAAPRPEEPGPGATRHRGVSVRRLDHVNYLGVEVEPNRDYLRDTLGALVTEQIVLDDGSTGRQLDDVHQQGLRLVYTRDRTGTAGRLHHIAFATDTREDILRAADIALDTGRVHRDRPAQARHPADLLPLRLRARRQPRRAAATRAPGSSSRPTGSRSTGPRTERAKGQAWGLKTIASFHTHGTPPRADAGPREPHDHRLPRPLHDRPGRAHRLARGAGRRVRGRPSPRRPTRRSPTTRSARRSRAASCGSWPSAGST